MALVAKYRNCIKFDTLKLKLLTVFKKQRRIQMINEVLTSALLLAGLVIAYAVASIPATILAATLDKVLTGGF